MQLIRQTENGSAEHGKNIKTALPKDQENRRCILFCKGAECGDITGTWLHQSVSNS